VFISRPAVAHAFNAYPYTCSVPQHATRSYAPYACGAVMRGIAPSRTPTRCMLKRSGVIVHTSNPPCSSRDLRLHMHLTRTHTRVPYRSMLRVLTRRTHVGTSCVGLRLREHRHVACFTIGVSSSTHQTPPCPSRDVVVPSVAHALNAYPYTRSVADCCTCLVINRRPTGDVYNASAGHTVVR